MTAHFEFDRMKDGRVCFVLIAEDGAVIARSAPFASESEAREAARLARAARLTESRTDQSSPLPEEERARRIREIRALAAEIRTGLPADAHSLDHGDILYDEDGLPR